MYFPWVGLLEQVRLADVFVHYDDVQFSRGFYNRVQVKGQRGMSWITIPTKNYHRGQNIDAVQVDNDSGWREQHREVLRQAYLNSPFCSEMLGLVDKVFASGGVTVGEISRASILALVEYFAIGSHCLFLDSKTMQIGGASTQRLLDITSALSGGVYITGHGAKNYLDHKIFKNANIRVEYMDYRRMPYPQLHGEFTPYVTALDLVANCGRDGRKYLVSDTKYWEDFIK